MGNKNSKSMSGSYSMKGTAPVGVGVKKGSLTMNGNGPPPLSYPADPPDDENMNEIIDKDVELTVVLPNGASYKQGAIESNIPMMDLLITIAASNKLNPAAHSLVVLTGDKWKHVDFKANKTIGLLAGEDRQVSVQIIKKKVEDKVKTKTATQPFEMTYRLTVNLPHNQKKVLRISPKLTLGEVRQLICKEKNFDPSHYVFLLPGNPIDSLEDPVTIGDLKTSEINFVSVTMIHAAKSRSMPDLAFSAARANNDASDTKGDSQYLSRPAEKKAKRGFLSFLGKKEKKSKLQHADMEITKSLSVKGRYSAETGSVQSRPLTVYTDSGELDHFGLGRTTGGLQEIDYEAEFLKCPGSKQLSGNENGDLSVKTESIQPDDHIVQNNRQSTFATLPKKSAKKRAAPAPPKPDQNTLTVHVEIDTLANVPVQSRIEDLPNERVQLKKNHSRNSSDSSGYHELALSGAESPNAHKGENSQTMHDTASIDSAEHFNGDSGIRDMSLHHRRSANKEAAGARSRDSSLDIDKPAAPGRKKKRAPLPPPGMSAGTSESYDTMHSQSKQEMNEAGSRMEVEEFEASQALEEVTMKFNIEDSDEEDDLRMVEDSSIHSEDIDLDINHRQRPATFFAPPPPTEPPPEDLEPIDLNRMDIQVDTIDIGVGEDTTSLGPNSAKSSPLTEELKRAMPEFKENLSKLTQDGTDGGEFSNRSHTSEQAETEDSDQSFIVHESRVSKDTKLRSSQGNRESSEITYEFTVDSVPADFMNDKAEESDESFVMEETVEYYPIQPGTLDLGSPRKIPDLDSPKEHKGFSLPVHELHADIPLDESTPKVSSGVGKTAKYQGESEPVGEKPPEKEEFVLTFDELTNMDFSATQPGEQKKVRSDTSEVPRVNYRVQFRSSADFDEEPQDIIQAESTAVVNQEPIFNDELENSSYDNGAKTKCSELSFSPDNEGEDEDMLEEKSISMINLPAERTPVKNSQDDGATTETFASSTNIVLSSSQLPSSQVNETSPRRSREESFDASNLMQTQYNQLQQQFTVWQNQLVQNQSLLATQGAAEYPTNQMSGKDDQSNLQLQQLQLQIQMQQQMMLQLQQSMQALALQNTLTSQQYTFPQTVNQPLVAMTTMQTQQTPSPPPSTQIFTKDNEKYRPSSPVEESPRGQIKVLSLSEPPNAPAAPPIATSKPKASRADAKYSKPKQKRYERQLDPREQLMFDIKNFGKTHLHKVPVKATHWHK